MVNKFYKILENIVCKKKILRKETKMEINRIDDFYDFLKVYSAQEENLIFRGVRNSSFKLTPSVGRIKTKDGKPLSIKDEQLILKIFKHRGYPFIKDYKDDELEILSIGQHHGLPTRLLDWTKNLLAAIYFSVEEPFTDEDKKKTNYSCIYIYKPTAKVNLDSTFDPFDIDKVKRFIPKHWDNRIIAQNGLFTVHPRPYTPWEPTGLIKVLIDFKIRKDIKTVLNRFGIHAGTIYPDLDGIARHIKYLRSNEH